MFSSLLFNIRRFLTFNNYMKKTLLSLIFLVLIFFAFAQTDLAVGKWRTHFSYSNGRKVVEVGNKVYCLTESGLFFVEKSDYSKKTLSKLDGLSDFEISNFDYDTKNKILLVAYQNTMIDLIKDNSITQVTELYRKSIPGKKMINDIFFYNDMAYLSCSFGIVVYDLIRLEVKETYSEIGANGKSPEIFQTTIYNGSIYAATSDGILKASISAPNLLDFNAWSNIKSGKSTMVTTFSPNIYGYTDNKLEKYDGTSWTTVSKDLDTSVNSMVVNYSKLIVCSKKGTYVFDNMGGVENKDKESRNYSIIDAEGLFWHAVNIYALVNTSIPGLRFFTPNGPLSNKCWDIASYGNVVWVITGSVSENYKQAFNRGGFYTFKDNLWYNNIETTTNKFDSFFDLNCITVNPKDKHVFIGSFGKGALEYFNDGIQTVYDPSNSSLDTFNHNNIIVTGLAIDSKSNLWVANREATNQLSVKFSNGTWKSYNLGTGVNKSVSKIVVDDNDAKWILLQPDKGILVFDETQPVGKTYKKMLLGTGNGNLPSNSVYSIAKDLDGKIWVGTNEGVAVFYDPYAVFTNGNYDAQKIWVENGDNSGYLLATETVTAIAVDGANNKWLGTKRGIWYVSDDGSKILFSFNTKNSPLPSDYIRSINVNDVTGEVFIATDKGLVSYRNVATKGAATHKEVYAYPNPVRPGYNGLITITGLMRDDNVKITDIAGNMVYEATTEGGQLSWDGKNFSGDLVRSGVYLIFCTNTDGTDSIVTKVLIIR
jgi:ligand-binding sensor domain-containing protein